MRSLMVEWGRRETRFKESQAFFRAFGSVYSVPVARYML